MTVAPSKKDKTQDFGQDEIETELNAFALKVHKAVEDARSKMSEERREEVDDAVEAIFAKANAAAGSSRRAG